MGKKDKTKFEENCYYHKNIPSGFICDTCGKSICHYCQKNYTLPYQCPECMPEYWSKKMKKERFICIGPVIIFIVFLIISFIWIVFFSLGIPDYSYLDMDDDDIIPSVDPNSFNINGTNEIRVDTKVYVTNDGDKDSGKVFVELYALRNGTSIANTQSTVSIIKSEKTGIFNLTFTIIPGNYEFQIMLWEDGKVIQKGVKKLSISTEDIEEISDHWEIERDEKSSKENDSTLYYGLSSFFIFIPIIIVILIIIVVWYINKDKGRYPPINYPPPPIGKHNERIHKNKIENKRKG